LYFLLRSEPYTSLHIETQDGKEKNEHLDLGSRIHFRLDLL
jgi:hypothetical protein